MRAPKTERLASAMRDQAAMSRTQFEMLQSLLARAAITDFVVQQAVASGALSNLAAEERERLRGSISAARQHADLAGEIGARLQAFIDTFEQFAE